MRGGGDGGGGDSEESCKDEGLEMAEGSNTSLVDVAGALSLISNKGGRRISASADGAPKDAYMGFLLLRHLRIRDLRAKVGWWGVCGGRLEGRSSGKKVASISKYTF